MNLHIICVDDQREVLAALRNDLTELPFVCEFCESADEAGEVLEDIDAEGGYVAVIVCDQVMPEKSGVEFLTEVAEDGRFEHVKKLLLTGLATHQDTIEAINKASIHAYMEKPWDVDGLLGEIRKLVTDFVLDVGLDYQSISEGLDPQRLYERLSKKS